jgi:hypothetical protein
MPNLKKYSDDFYEIYQESLVVQVYLQNKADVKIQIYKANEYGTREFLCQDSFMVSNLMSGLFGPSPFGKRSYDMMTDDTRRAVIKITKLQHSVFG